jgi:formamidopyrimidine-DNA glycosylase
MTAAKTLMRRGPVMPELPELEILRGNLDKELNGKKMKGVEITVPAIVKRNTNKRVFAGRLDGVKFGGTTRQGTWLITALDSGDVLVFGLADKALLRRTQNKDAVDKGTAMTLTFTQHGQLRVIDPAKKSEVFVATPEELPDIVGHPGLDLVAEPISWTAFGERLLRQKGKLKSILMDPTFLVGVGPIYSDEVLFESGLRYDRDPQTMSTQEIRRLFRSTVEIIHDALKYNGTSLGDDGFVDVFGKRGTYQNELAVYQKEGEMSPRARGPVVKTRFGSGYTYYCEQTQM